MNAILFHKVLTSDFFMPPPQSANKAKIKPESNILNEGGFHPVSKDVNRIMKSFFDGEEVTTDNKHKTE